MFMSHGHQLEAGSSSENTGQGLSSDGLSPTSPAQPGTTKQEKSFFIFMFTVWISAAGELTVLRGHT